jgi:hypothetical protein
MSTFIEVEINCPFCGEKVKHWDIGSYYQYGINLDFKPLNDLTVPMAFAKCEKCSFVFYDDLFTKDEIIIIKNKLIENNIFKNEPNMPNCYYLAKECEFVNKDVENIIYYYHCAIWENDNEDKNIFEKISNIMFAYFDNIDKQHENYYIYLLIKLDILRKLGKFETALSFIETLKDEKEFPHDKFKNLLEYQTTLIEQKDTEEHQMGGEEK